MARSLHRSLLHPSFILRDKSVDPRLQILINSINDDERSDTLEPLLPSSPAQLPFNEERPLEDDYQILSRSIKIAGSCNGLICIADGNYDLILWNPATSETKLVPRSPSRLGWILEAVGFGFDPETDDYKVIRQLGYEDGSRVWRYFSEVDCLRSD